MVDSNVVLEQTFKTLTTISYYYSVISANQGNTDSTAGC